MQIWPPLCRLQRTLLANEVRKMQRGSTSEISSEIQFLTFKIGREIQESAKKVLVTGDRNWTSRVVVLTELIFCRSLKTLVEGEAHGADKISADLAENILKLEDIRRYPADWDKLKRAAGPIRNREMLKERPDLVLAFHDDLEGKSKGTKDMVKISLKAGVPVKHITSKGEVHWYLPTR